MKTLNLTNAKTPAAAAKKLVAYIKKTYDGDATLRNPKETEEHGYMGKVWSVSWEEGPFEWAVAASLGGRFNESFNGFKYDKGPEIEGWSNPNWLMEPYHTYDIGFSE